MQKTTNEIDPLNQFYDYFNVYQKINDKFIFNQYLDGYERYSTHIEMLIVFSAFFMNLFYYGSSSFYIFSMSIGVLIFLFNRRLESTLKERVKSRYPSTYLDRAADLFKFSDRSYLRFIHFYEQECSSLTGEHIEKLIEKADSEYLKANNNILNSKSMDMIIAICVLGFSFIINDYSLSDKITIIFYAIVLVIYSRTIIKEFPTKSQKLAEFKDTLVSVKQQKMFENERAMKKEL